MDSAITSSKLQEAIEIVEALPEETQQALVDVVSARLREWRKTRIVAAVNESRASYKNGIVSRGSARDLMSEVGACEN